MTPQDIRLVQRSWKALQPLAGAVAAVFYERLFELDPPLRALFRGDMDGQRRKLVAMITAAVSTLGDMDTLGPELRELGRRHAGYGVSERDYETAGAALLWSLERGLAADFTPPVQRAWAAVFSTLARMMRDAARQPVMERLAENIDRRGPGGDERR